LIVIASILVYHVFKPRSKWIIPQTKNEVAKRFYEQCSPPEYSDDVIAYVALGNYLFKAREEKPEIIEEKCQYFTPKSAFLRAAYAYAKYLFTYKRGGLSKAEMELPLLEWIENAYAKNDLSESDNRDLKEIREYVKHISKNKMLNKQYLIDKEYFEREFIKEFVKEYGYRPNLSYSDTEYEIVDAYVAIGLTCFASGNYKEAQKAFLRALWYRLHNDSRPIAYFRPVLWNEFRLILFSKGSEELKELKNFFKYFYGWEKQD
jgi:hypothetical protein